jgi:acyl-coenzyme A thioesterase PaaI-like protein
VSYEDKIATIDMRIDYLKPGEPRDLIAEAMVLRSGNRVVLTEMWLHHGDRTQLVAIGKAAYNVHRKPDSAKEAKALDA